MEPFLFTFYYFLLAIGVILVGLIIFELLTKKYKDWDEIKNGNHAVALSIGGKIVGISIILTFAVYNSGYAQIIDTIVWGGYGVLLQLLAYVLFELLTRKFSVQEQLQKGNISVGIISFCVSVGLAFVIGASIT